MSLWSRLFGDRETAEQKIARARTHLDEGEPKLAIDIVARLDGPEVDEIRRRARDLVETIEQRATERPPVSIEPDDDDPLHASNQPSEAAPTRSKRAARQQRVHGGPYREPTPHGERATSAPPPEGGLTLQFNADGSTSIGTGHGVVTLNAPTSDDDGQSRSTDALDVARRLIIAMSDVPLDPRAFAFVDAVVVLARAGEAIPAVRDPHRHALVEHIHAARTRDPGAMVAALRSCPPDLVAELAHFAPPLAVRFAARELGQLSLEGRAMPSVSLMKALVKVEPELCVRILANEPDPELSATTLLLAEEAGVEIPGLAARWSDWQSAVEPLVWGALSIRRLAVSDLDAALALATDYASEYGPDYAADLALATNLAKADPARAVATLRAFEPHVDHAGWLAGLARANVTGAGDLVDTWIDALGPHTYDPWSYFAELLAACIELADVDRTRRCIAAAGPTGWQIACAAYHPIARVPDPARRASLLGACYERVQPGIVAGRAIPFGGISLGAGKMVHQPAWLAFRDPHPVESLALPVALGDDAPSWT